MMAEIPKPPRKQNLINQNNPDENLLRNVPKEKPKRTYSFYLSLALDASAIFFALLSGFLYRSFLENRSLWWTPLVVLIFFFVVSALETILVPVSLRRIAILFLESLGFTVFFFHYSWAVSISALGVGLVFLGWGEALSRLEIKSELKIRFFKIIYPQFQKMATALSLMALILYLPNLNSGNVFLSPGSFQKVYNSVAGFTNGLYPELNFSSSVGDLAKSIALPQLQRNIDLKDLPQSEQSLIISQAQSQIIGGLSQNLGISINPRQPISEIIYNYILSTLQNWRQRFSGLFIAFWLLLMYFLIRSLGTVFVWLVIGATYFIYQILLEFNILKITTVPSYRERVEFF